MINDKEIVALEEELGSLKMSCDAMARRQRQSETCDALLAYIHHGAFNHRFEENCKKMSKDEILDRYEHTIENYKKLLEAYDVIWDAMMKGNYMFESGQLKKNKKMFGLF